MPLQQGQVLNNRYRIVKLQGQGGFGSVYKAWDINLNSQCALKENLDGSDAATRQFSREASILASLRHPNLPRVSDYFTVPGQGQYLVMDYVEGDNLQVQLDQGIPLAEEAVIDWMKQIANALTYMHGQPQPIIHRDLKPSNISITPDDRALLLDFGISKVYQPALPTTVGARAVTPGFSPPEQYGQGTSDVRSDVYAFGATIYALLTTRVPTESIQRVTGASLELPRTLNPAISPETERVIMRAMELQPSLRFQSIAEAVSALTATTVVPATPALYRYSRATWLWASGGLVLVLVGIGLGQWLGRPSAPPAATAQIAIVSPTMPPAVVVLPATSTATAQPTNTPSPRSTSTAAPTTTGTPTAAPVVPACEFEPWSSVYSVWLNYETELGCAIEPVRSPHPINEQVFQNGHMFWTGDVNELFVIRDNEQRFDWVNPPTGIENTPPLGCSAPASNVRQPRGGFAWMWQRIGGCNASIGWALDEQHSFTSDRIQTFKGGRILQDSDGVTKGRVYVLFNTLRFVKASLR